MNQSTIVSLDVAFLLLTPALMLVISMTLKKKYLPKE